MISWQNFVIRGPQESFSLGAIFSVFTSLVFVVTLQNITTMRNENQLYLRGVEILSCLVTPQASEKPVCLQFAIHLNILSLYIILGCTDFSFELVITPAWVPCFFSKINSSICVHLYLYWVISYLFQDVLLIILEVLLRWLIGSATKVRKTSLPEMVYIILSPRLSFLGFWMSERCWISFIKFQFCSPPIWGIDFLRSDHLRFF